MLGLRNNRLGQLLERGRNKFETRMRDTCVIRRPGEKVSDGRGGETVEMVQVYPDPGWPEDHPHADGKCYTRYPGLAFESNRDLVGVHVVESRLVVRVPVGPTFRPDDVVEITASPDTPHLVGEKFRVASIDDQSQATAQRLLCEVFQKGVHHEDS